MDATDIALRLLDLDKSERDRILASAITDYFKVLYAIAADIYDSCIQDFYAKYTPKVYERHGNLEGENLYRANEISYEKPNLSVFIDSAQLLPYGNGDVEDIGDTEDKRDFVLNSVMKGLRGAKSSKLPGWPKHWYTRYPNQYSTQAGVWSSSKRTINGILYDFIENVMGDTDNILWEIVASKM